MAFQGEYFVDRYGAAAAEHTPPIRRMLEMGVPVGLGTDATRVASYNPWVALVMARHRRDGRRAHALPEDESVGPAHGAPALHARLSVDVARRRREGIDRSRASTPISRRSVPTTSRYPTTRFGTSCRC